MEQYARLSPVLTLCPLPLPQVVYAPACVTRIMGPAKGDYETGEGPACALWGG